MTDDSQPYVPIDCSLHDRVEDVATRRQRVRIDYEGARGPAELHDTIVDWFVRDGAEFMRTGGGAVIRMDRILSVDGVRYRPTSGEG